MEGDDNHQNENSQNQAIDNPVLKTQEELDELQK